MTPATFNVHGKTAVITGAGSGICLEFAKLLLEKGCNVVVGDISLRPEAERLLHEYQEQPKVIYQKTDVSSWTDLNKLFAGATDTFGTFDIVCPGAGVWEPDWSNFWLPPGDPASKDPVDGPGRYGSLDILLIHPIRASQLALAEFLAPTNGSTAADPANPKRIVLVSSIACELAVPTFVLYGIAKHGVAALARTLGPLESLSGIRVNAVCPGVIETPMWMDNAERMEGFDPERDVFVSPRAVAEAMHRLLVDEDLEGGTCLEVGLQTRKIPLYGNVMPQDLRGLSVSNPEAWAAQLLAKLSRPGWGKVDDGEEA